MIEFPHIKNFVEIDHPLTAIVDKIHAGIFVFNPERKLIAINDWLLSRLKTEPSKILGEDIFEIFPELILKKVDHAVNLVMQSKIPITLSNKFHQFFIRIPPDDAYSNFEFMQQYLILYPMIKDQKIESIFGLIYDVTDRVLSEKNLRQELLKMELLHEIDQSLSSLNLEVCVQKSNEKVRRLFNADRVNLLLCQAGELRPFFPCTEVQGIDPAPQLEFVRYVSKIKQAAILDDPLKDSLYKNETLYYQSEMGVPLLIKDQVVGVIQVCAQEKNHFVPENLTIIKLLASRVAQTIYNTRLHTQEHEQRLLAEALTQITMSIASELEINVVLNLILDAIVSVVPYDSASIFLEEDGKIQVQCHRGYDQFDPEEKISQEIWDLSQMPLVRELLRQKNPIAVMDVDQEPRWFRSQSAQHVRSWCGIPIYMRGNLLGFISLDKSDPGFYTEERIAPLTSFAASAGIAIQNARLYARQVSLANLDGLTGLPNRRSFDKHLAEEMQRAIRLGDPVSLIILDVDHFKQFNDTYGHLVGDDVLKQLAKTLNHNLRMMDTAARFGGEEFAIILPHTPLEDAYQVAERLRKLVESQQLLPELNLAITISLGVASAPESGITPKQLIQSADEVLFEAKNNGRNRTKKAKPAVKN